jgi:hypothetical protein
MPLTFVDLNFIVTAHQGPEDYKEHIRQLGVSGAVTFVLSPMHWVDAADDADAARRASKGDFMDSINARWLYERRTIQRKEVADKFFTFANIPHAAPEMTGPLEEVIRDLVGVAAERHSRDFIDHLRGVGANHPLQTSLQAALESNQVNGERFRAGIIDRAFLGRMEKLYIQQLLPNQTPQGLLIDENTKQQFLAACTLTDFPAFAVESLATYDSWTQNRQMNRNNFIDQQHLMALPYVDLFITDDARLKALVGRIAPGLPFRVATMMTRAEFDAQYPA